LEKEGLFLLLRNPCSNRLVNAACLWSPLLTCSNICGSDFHGGSKFFTKSPCHGIFAFLLFRRILTQSLQEIGLVKKEIGLVCLTNHTSFPLLQYRLKTQILLSLSVSKHPFLWRGLENQRL
jgi:hypothetical protein